MSATTPVRAVGRQDEVAKETVVENGATTPPHTNVDFQTTTPLQDTTAQVLIEFGTRSIPK